MSKVHPPSVPCTIGMRFCLPFFYRLVVRLMSVLDTKDNSVLGNIQSRTFE